MSRRAAGGAGRPAVPVRVWTLLTAALVTVLGVLAAPATATAAPTTAPPASGTPGNGSASTTSRPVQVTVTTLEPRTLTLGGSVQVAGTLVNDSDDTLTDVSVRLQRGDPLTTRSDLAADVASPSTGDAAQTTFTPVPGDLDPGDSLPFVYTTTTAELGITEDGVYPLLVNANGSRDGVQERVGELSSYLVVQPAAPTTRTTVAWLWPLTDRPHRDATGAFTDDELAATVSADGRLDRALDVLEQLPGGGAGVPVTLAVDPALVEELSAMAGGYTVDGVAGAGTAAATDWLDRLRALAALHPLAALPYADVDADALQAAGLAAVLTRSLPGTPEGTAVQSGGGDESAADPSTGAGARLLARTLDVTPRTDLAWPAGGTVRSDTLDTLQAGGVGDVVLSAGAYRDPGAALGATGAPAAARVPVPTATGEATTLVADDTLAQVVASAATSSTPRVAEQRYLAELGVLTGQLAAADPAGTQTVLVVPPRDVDADPAWATAMIADTTTQPWLAAASVEELAAGPTTAGGQLLDPVGDQQLAPAGMAEIARSVAVRDDVAAAVVTDPASALAAYDAAIARASSSSWLGDPTGFAASAADLEATVTALRGQVTLLAPADGAYSLASSDAPLVLTVRNDLPFAVSVQLTLTSRGGVGFTADPVPATVLEPGTRTTITVPTQVRQSGSFTVLATLTTATGGALGESVQLRVTSTAYGPITLTITLGAAALLALLFLRRLVRFVLRRRRGEARPVDDDVLVPVDPAADGGGSPADTGSPPTRSRV